MIGSSTSSSDQKENSSGHTKNKNASKDSIQSNSRRNSAWKLWRKTTQTYCLSKRLQHSTNKQKTKVTFSISLREIATLRIPTRTSCLQSNPYLDSLQCLIYLTKSDIGKGWTSVQRLSKSSWLKTNVWNQCPCTTRQTKSKRSKMQSQAKLRMFSRRSTNAMCRLWET